MTDRSNLTDPNAPPYDAEMPPPMPGQVAAPVLPYMTPFAATTAMQGVWRDGNKLITTRSAALPPLCVKCAAPADGSYKPRTYYWHNPLWALFVLVALLLYALIALIVRKKSVVVCGLCRAHQSRRTKLILATWFLSLGGFAAMIAGPVIGSEERTLELLIPVGLLGGLGVIIAALFTGFGARVLVPTKMDEHYAWFKGCGGAFLEQLPPAR